MYILEFCMKNENVTVNNQECPWSLILLTKFYIVRANFATKYNVIHANFVMAIAPVRNREIQKEEKKRIYVDHV